MSMHPKNLRTSEATTMITSKLRPLALLAALVAVAVSGCEPGPRIDRVQTNLIDKSVFEGEWWFTHTVVDLSDSESWAIGAAGAGAPWPGATANFDIASQSGVVGRIRWVVDENFLFAYRSSEIVQGSSADARDPEFRGQPLAAYRISGHFDVRQDFNPVTGEPGNVVSENTDRRWYDRRFVRVDWSQNLVTWGLFGASLEIDQLFGTFRRESVPLGVLDEGLCADPENPDARCDLPAEWAPQFVRLGDETACDPSGESEGACYRFLDEWPADQRDAVHYMSFVTQELWTPLQCVDALCETSIRITVRDAFLRIPPNHEYATETLANSEYDRFGIIRTESRTYTRGGEDRSTIGRRCDTNLDCDPGCDPEFGIECEVVCDTTQHVCVGGLTNELGETDFLTYYRLRHNFYSDSLRDQECIADWQCSGRYDGGTGANGGSVCDQHARRCTVPLHERPVRAVHYTLSADYPTYLTRSAFELVAQWNDAFMRGNREQREGRNIGGVTVPPPPTGARVAMQSADPTQYCYGRDGFLSPEVDRDTMDCAHVSNYFVRPEERNEENPFDCWIEGPADLASPTDFADYDVDSDGNEVVDAYEYRFRGSECMLVLDVNDCDRNPGAACQQLGDLRYQFFNYVSGAGAGWCGVMQPNQDPLTGEAIISPVNMGGLCLDSTSQVAINIWPILRGEQPADPLFEGEEIRQYFERLGRVRSPVGLAPGAAAGSDVGGGPRPSLPTDLHAHFEDVIETHAARVERLHGREARAQLLSERLQNIAGSGLERRFTDGVAMETFQPTRPAELQATSRLATGRTPTSVEQELVSRYGMSSPAQFADAVRDRASPARDAFLGDVMAERRREQLLGESGTCMLFENEYQLISQYGRYWANAFDGVALPTARIRWAQAFHRAVMQHELGHGLGLEHNFGATLDRDHYNPAYFNVEMSDDCEDLSGARRSCALPLMTEFDADRNGVLTDVETNVWLQEFQNIRSQRQERGLGNYTTSSTMDYPGDESDSMGIGFYDRGAVYFNYFNMIESFEGDPRHEEPGTSRDDLLRSDVNGRELWTWYRGGDQCRVDAQCPMAAGSSGLAPGQAVTQRCVSNPRYSSIPVPCGDLADPEAARHCICSNFDEDMVDYVAGAAYRPPSAPLDYYPVNYLFCSNSRLNDISWCSTFDAGESFLEVTANMRTAWESSYPTAYFRRFRRPFYAGSRATRWIPDAAKIYQHLLFRYYYETGFGSDAGPLGFDDQFMASVDSMNFLSYLAQLPDVGSYDYDATTDTYVHMGETPGMAGSEFTLEAGQGFHTWSAYQEGLQGFWRLERAGTFFDKLIALRALTIRDWGLSFTIDERYFINFYDLFPVEMTELFGGYVIDDPHWYAPRVTVDDGEATLEYVNWYRANCREAGTGALVPCRGPNTEVFPGSALGGTSNDVLRFYAAAFALSEFPVFYDSSWEQRLAVFKLGNADGFDIPDTQPDGDATCAFGTAIDAGHALCTDPLEADYIVYESNRLHVSYVAVKVRPRIEYNLEEEQLGFALLLEMTRNQQRIEELEALATRTPEQERELRNRQRELERNESFLETLIEVQRIFGITSWL
ncbi:hypothetical protein [Sandaracinus amylolyticus]|nr:hypothetical protein [Sandaracinus amylolyticus]